MERRGSLGTTIEYGTLLAKEEEGIQLKR